MHRRRFLQTAAASLLAGASGRLFAAPSGGSDARLLLVFLRGGYDALSALSPYTEADYHEARPHVAIGAPAKGKVGAAVALDAYWALHPVLVDSLLPLYEANQAAFVPFAGTDFVSRSHFQAQDWVEFGQPAGGSGVAAGGFLNRLLQVLQRGQAHSDAVSFTRALPPVMRGAARVANAPVSMARAAAMVPELEDRILALYRGHELERPVRDGIGLRRQIAEELRQEMTYADRGAAPAQGFALEAGRIARVMREHPRYRIGFIELGGWDTHAGQGAAQGGLANQLRGLGEGLEILADTLGPVWRRTVVVVLSEFGRTFRENGTKGTDHGHGSTLWVLGGDIQGGRIHGEQTRLRFAALHQDRDTPVLNDQRAVLAGLMRDLFALTPADVAEIFPGARSVGIRLV